MKKILITGGAGFIGSNLAQALLNKGYYVRVLDNLTSGKLSNIEPFASNPYFEFIEGDIRSLDTCIKACSGMDAVSHQAALGSVPRSIKNPSATNEVNVGGFVNMLQAARDAGIKRVVYASSSSVYGDEPNLPKREDRIGKPLSPYAVSKFTNEVYADVFARNYGMELIGFRYFNVFGPKQDPYGEYAAVMPLFIKALLSNEAPFINGDGLQTRDFTYVDNAVQANILGLSTESSEAVNQVYNIALGQRYSILEMYEAICTQLNKNIQPQFRSPREGDIRDSLADISKAKTLLGYNPTHSFKEGLPLTIAYFKQLFSGE
jgi:UDP-N-acetylglucosamine 4-epimerase